MADYITPQISLDLFGSLDPGSRNTLFTLQVWQSDLVPLLG